MIQRHHDDSVHEFSLLTSVTFYLYNSALKKCSRAGTGCGGCEPQVKAILGEELEKLGGALSNHMCEHFPYSRQELMAKIRLEEDLSSVDSFEKILAKYGSGDGCETCKPAVGGILAQLVNGMILDDGRDALQDTNDRSLANMQRGGTYCELFPGILFSFARCNLLDSPNFFPTILFLLFSCCPPCSRRRTITRPANRNG